MMAGPLSKERLDELFSDTAQLRRYLEEESPNNKHAYMQIINTAPDRINATDDVDELMAIQDCINIAIEKWGEVVDELLEEGENMRDRLDSNNLSGIRADDSNADESANDDDAGGSKTGDEEEKAHLRGEAGTRADPNADGGANDSDAGGSKTEDEEEKEDGDIINQ